MGRGVDGSGYDGLAEDGGDGEDGADGEKSKMVDMVELVELVLVCMFMLLKYIFCAQAAKCGQASLGSAV